MGKPRVSQSQIGDERRKSECLPFMGLESGSHADKEHDAHECHGDQMDGVEAGDTELQKVSPCGEGDVGLKSRAINMRQDETAEHEEDIHAEIATVDQWVEKAKAEPEAFIDVYLREVKQ